MRVLCIALTIFAAGFMVHWICWRVRIPRRQTAALLAIFGLTIAAGLIALSRNQPTAEADFWALRNAWQQPKN